MSGDTPPPMGQFGDIGLLMHDAFLSFCTAGFTPDQAVYLTGKMVVALMPKQTPDATEDDS